MTTDLVRRVSTYAGEIELALGHCVASGYECGGCGLAKEVPGGCGFNRHKLSTMVSLKFGL
jgi:hypothetical protein